MLPKTPEEICSLFRQYITEGNIDSVLSVYEPEVAFLTYSIGVNLEMDQSR
jgi:hypothetical protein